MYPAGTAPLWSDFWHALLQPDQETAHLALHISVIADTTVMLIVFPMTAILIEVLQYCICMPVTLQRTSNMMSESHWQILFGSH